LPEESAVVVLLAAPLSVTVAPVPAAAGLTVPEMVHVCGGARVSANVFEVPPELAVNVAVWAVVTAATVAVKVPVKAPASTFTLAGTVTLVLLLESDTLDPPVIPAELRVTVQADDPAPVKLAGVHERLLTVGAMTVAVKLTAVKFAPLTVSAWEAGAVVYPLFDAVTV